MAEKVVHEDDPEDEPGICGIVKKAINPENAGTKALSCVFVFISPNQASDAHYHGTREEVFYFTSGRGYLLVGSKNYIVKKGVIAFIPPKTPHKIVNTGKGILKLLAMGTPPFNTKDTFAVFL